MSTHEQESQAQQLREYDPTRPHSFDLTLELERQLDAESLPSSPSRIEGRPRSLDTNVLASLVTSLRMNLAELTKERDELSATLDAVRHRESDLTTEVRQLRDAQVERDTELATLRQKTRDDEESIILLRSKVEESRRGLMRLQTQNRRQSRGADLSVDLSRAGSFSFGGPSSGKRMSFTPLTGSSAGRIQNHRRISSVSDSEVDNGQAGGFSPNPPTINLPDTSPNVGFAPASARRISGLFSRTSASESDPLPGFNVVEKDQLQREVQALKTALEEARHELSEANEAREASETCVKALRDFIAENNVGLSSPRMDVGSPGLRNDDTDKKAVGASGSSRWGFGGLFRAGEVTSPVIPSRGASTTVSPVVAAEPLSRKLGGLFSGRGSFSSATSAAPRSVPVVQEGMYNSSDTSSTAESAEPASPRTDTSQMPITTVLSGTSYASSGVIGLQNASKRNDSEVLMV